MENRDKLASFPIIHLCRDELGTVKTFAELEKEIFSQYNILFGNYPFTLGKKKTQSNKI